MTSVLGNVRSSRKERLPVRKFGNLFLLLFLLGSLVRLVGVERPIELPNNWREFDVASVSRNFEREGMDILFPRIDWRGDGPGFAEMELPIYPWTAALLYQVFGEHEIILRLISYAFSLAALAIFILLARRFLPPAGALAATLFFILGPLPNNVGHAVQPEGLMLFAYLGAVYYFLRWLDSNATLDYVGWAFLTALAILAKTPAAHIGLFFFIMLFRAGGMKRLLSPQVVTFPLWTLAPALLWYVHAYKLWRTFGNSLGASNEDHFIGLDVITSPRLWGGLIGIEGLFVWALFGVAVAAYGLLQNRTRPVVAVAGFWTLTVLLYAVLCGRTLAGLWAWYYHIVAVPPAALLFGHGVEQLARVRRNWGTVTAVWIGSGILSAFAWTLLAARIRTAAPQYASQLAGKPLGLPLEALILFIAVASCLIILANASARIFERSDWVYWLALACVCPSFYLAAELSFQRSVYDDGADLRMAAEQLQPLIPAKSKIVTIGAACLGSGLHRYVASDAPYMFYWLDRKGFSVCRERLTVEGLRRLADRGAEYFIAEKTALDVRDGFAGELARSFTLTGEAGDLQLYSLKAKQAEQHPDWDYPAEPSQFSPMRSGFAPSAAR